MLAGVKEIMQKGTVSATKEEERARERETDPPQHRDENGEKMATDIFLRSSFEQASPHSIAVGSQADLSDLKVRPAQ